jgi:histidinol-phosphate aminotransferase
VTWGVPLRDDLRMLEAYHSPQVAVSVRLNTNESPLPPPRGWVEAVQREIAGIEFNRYPDRSARSLREAIGGLHGVAEERVFCANGSNEVLLCLLLAFGGAGRTAAVFEPTYALHSHIARLTGMGVAVGERGAGFELDLGEVSRVLADRAPAVTLLCSPNNPTGMEEAEAAVREVIELAPGLVVVDEAYGQFSSWSALALAGSSDRLVVVRTFSKTWSMAASRLGYAVCAPEVVRALERVALPYHLDAVKQAAGRLALQFEPEMRERVAMLIEERGRLAAGLAELGVEQWPSASNFILFRLGGRDAHEVWQRLLEHDVLVRDCSDWPRLSGCLRVTVGTRAENDAFLAALGSCLS